MEASSNMSITTFQDERDSITRSDFDNLILDPNTPNFDFLQPDLTPSRW